MNAAYKGAAATAFATAAIHAVAAEEYTDVHAYTVYRCTSAHLKGIVCAAVIEDLSKSTRLSSKCSCAYVVETLLLSAAATGTSSSAATIASASARTITAGWQQLCTQTCLYSSSCTAVCHSTAATTAAAYSVSATSTATAASTAAATADATSDSNSSLQRALQRDSPLLRQPVQ
eukprot:7796-Heterococcus_DN1.PRE.1